MSKAILKIKKVKHPMSEEIIGFRIQAAIPNTAGRDYKGNPVPAFTKKFLIEESSDHTGVQDQDIARFCANRLSFHGYNAFEIVSDQRV